VQAVEKQCLELTLYAKKIIIKSMEPLRLSLGIIAITLLLILTISYTLPSAVKNRQGSPYVEVVGNKFYLYGQEFVPKVVNYYPRDYNWNEMWNHFFQLEDSGVLDHDMALAKSIGINVVRIIVQYNAVGGPNVNEENLTKIDHMLSIIDRHNMKAIVTLLDWSNPKESIDDHIKHVKTIVSRFRDDPRIFAWDVRNEPDHFWDGSWSPFVSKPEMISYLRNIIQAVREVDTNHTVTVGEYGNFLGDRRNGTATIFSDNFDDGNYDGWTVLDGSWSVSNGELIGENGTILVGEDSWYDYSLTVRMRTLWQGNQTWNVARIMFRYIDENNYYALLLRSDGYVELAKMQNGVWKSNLVTNYTGASPGEWHTFHIVLFRNETEVFMDGNLQFDYWDDEPIRHGKIALWAEGSKDAYDDVSVDVGPSILWSDVFNDVDFLIFHWYTSSDILRDALSVLRSSYDGPILIEEIGKPTAGENIPWDEEYVATWLNSTLDVLASFDGVYPGVWCLLDYTQIPGISGDSPEKHFGLFNINYEIKKNGIAYRDHYQGSPLYNDAEIISVDKPSSMNVGEISTVNVVVKNTGTVHWDRGRDYRLGSQQPRDNQIWGTGRAYIGEGDVVYPGDEYTFSFNIRAPSVPGKYSFSWRMLREYVEWFGTTYYGNITVRDSSRNIISEDEFPSKLSNWTVKNGSATVDSEGVTLWSGSIISNYSFVDGGFSMRYRDLSGDALHVYLRYRDEGNYVEIVLHPNCSCELYTSTNGYRQKINSTVASFDHSDYTTVFVELNGTDAIVYINGERVLEGQVPSSLDVEGRVILYSAGCTKIDYAAIYTEPAVPEMKNVVGVFVLLIILSLVLRSPRISMRNNFQTTHRLIKSYAFSPKTFFPNSPCSSDESRRNSCRKKKENACGWRRG